MSHHTKILLQNKRWRLQLLALQEANAKMRAANAQAARQLQTLRVEVALAQVTV